MIQLCLAEKGKVSIQYYFPVQNREYGIADIPGAKRSFEPETLYLSQNGGSHRINNVRQIRAQLDTFRFALDFFPGGIYEFSIQGFGAASPRHPVSS